MSFIELRKNDIGEHISFLIQLLTYRKLYLQLLKV